MALEDITGRILAKAGEEADGILSDAEERADTLKAEASARVTAQEKAARDKAAVEAEALSARLVAAAELEAKKAVLSARQSIITTVIEKAMETLSNTSDSDYMDFLANLLRDAPIDGEVDAIVSKDDFAFMKANLATLQYRLHKTGKTIRLHLSDDTREIGGGILLRQDKIEYNASLPAIRRAQEEDLRALAARILFPKEPIV